MMFPSSLSRLTRYAMGGFTLAELLIALAILAVIATFVIPKVLQAQQDQKQKAVIQESIAMMEALTYQYAMEYPTEGAQNLTTFKRSHINAVKFCNDSLTEGCWTADMASTGESDEPGFILPNGAYETGGLNYAGPNPDGFDIDWNGPLPPNQIGQDTYHLALCLAPNACSDGTLFGRLKKNMPDYQRAFQ